MHEVDRTFVRHPGLIEAGQTCYRWRQLGQRRMENGQRPAPEGYAADSSAPKSSKSDAAAVDSDPDDAEHRKSSGEPAGANWWTRRCGGREVLQLALPLVFSTASWTVMHFIDRIFLTWLSTEAIAAAMPAGMLHFSAICLPMGIAGYVNTFVAQYYGAGRMKRIGPVVWQGVLLALATVPLYWLMLENSAWFFRDSGHGAAIEELEAVYFRALGYGAPAAVFAAALASFFTGIGRPGVVMLIDSSSAALNVGLDYLLIFGGLGIEPHGIAGAGWATSIAQWVKVTAYLAFMIRGAYRSEFALFSNLKFDRQIFGRLIWFGGPSGLQVFVEVSAFTAFSMLMGQLGELKMAATTIAFSVNSIAFVPMIGLGIAVSTMVGQQLGAGRPDLAERATWTSICLGALYTCTLAVAFVAIPDVFLMAHASGSEEFTELTGICRVLLRFVAAYCVLDMLQIVFASAVKGAGDTKFVLLSTLLISPIPVLLAWFGLRQWGWGLTTFWWVVTIWIWTLSMVFWARFRFGPWRRMSVIESADDSPLAG